MVHLPAIIFKISNIIIFIMPRVNGSVVNPAQWDLDENNPVDGADMLQGRTGVRAATGDDLPVGAIQAREQCDNVLSTAWRLQTRFGSAPAPCRLPLCIN